MDDQDVELLLSWKSAWSQSFGDAILSMLLLMKQNLLEKAQELSLMQQLALVFISHRKDVCMSDLGRILQIQGSSINNLLKELISRDLVICKQRNQDKRSKSVKLTEKGQRMMHALRNLYGEKARYLLYKFPPEEIEKITSQLCINAHVELKEC